MSPGGRLLRVTIFAHFSGLISVLGGRHFFVMRCLSFPMCMHFSTVWEMKVRINCSAVNIRHAAFDCSEAVFFSFHMLRIAIVLGRNLQPLVFFLSLGPSGRN